MKLSAKAIKALEKVVRDIEELSLPANSRKLIHPTTA